jgi:hypothetical protein
LDLAGSAFFFLRKHSDLILSVAGEDEHIVEAFVFPKYKTGISDLMKPRLEQALAITLAKSGDELVAALRKDAFSVIRHRYLCHYISVILVALKNALWMCMGISFARDKVSTSRS